MAEIGKSLKGIWLKSMEAISNTASSIASNTKYKVDEMNIVNRRREILSDFGAQSYELWQKGEKFPEQLDALLKELSELDEALNAIRTEKLAGVKTDEEDKNDDKEESVLAATEDMIEDVADAVEDTAEAAAEIAKNSMAEKFDNAVDAVGATFKKLGSKIEGGIEALTKAMKPKMEEAAEPAKEEAVVEVAEEAVPVIEVEEPAEEAEVVSLEENMPAEPVAPVIEVEPEVKEDPQA